MAVLGSDHGGRMEMWQNGLSVADDTDVEHKSVVSCTPM